MKLDKIVLMYHSFRYIPDRYHITPQTFKSHLEECFKSPNVILTIDDGVPSVYKVAFPIMQDLNVSATIFIDTAEMGKSRMTAGQIREMSSAGFDMQSHSHTHRDHYHLTDESIMEEGHISKDILEQITGKSVDKYAFPGGGYDLRGCEILNSVGYNEFYTSDYGVNKETVGKYKIYDRIEIFCDRSLNYFFRKDVIMKRRLRIGLSKLKMKYFPSK